MNDTAQPKSSWWRTTPATPGSSGRCWRKPKTPASRSTGCPALGGPGKLGRGEIDLVLLDLGLPDSRGLETFVRAYAHAPQVPFVVLTGLDDETLALTAVRKGAQDYLVKGQTDGEVAAPGHPLRHRAQTG